MRGKLTSLMAFVLAVSAGHVARADLQAGLVAHWEFEGDFQDSVGTSHATARGDARIVTDAERGRVVEFDGTGDYLEIPHSPALNIAGDQLTLAAWVWHDNVAGDPEIIIAKVYNNTTHSSPYFSYGLHILTNGQPRVWISRTGGTANAPGTTNLQSAKWYHLAGVYDGTQLRLYLDGRLVAANAVSGTIIGYNTVLRLGINGGLTEPMDGKLDDVRIYNRALSEMEVLSLATGISLNKAWRPVPADGAVGVSVPLLQWNPGETARFHDVYFGTTAELTEADLVSSRQPMPMYWHAPGLEPGVTYHWRVDEVEADMVTVHTGDMWHFTAEPLAAYAPKPADGAANVFTAPALSWSPGQAALQHQLYFGSNRAEVTEGLPAADKGRITAMTFDPGLLRASTTYYWRVDEIKVDGSIEPGAIWSFSTEAAVPGGIVREWWSGIGGTAVTALKSDADFPGNPDGREILDIFEGPTNWQDNYGSRLRGWLAPPESGEYTFWIASDDSSELWLSPDTLPANARLIASVSGYTALRQWDKYATQRSSPMTLQAGQKYYVEAIMKDGTGGDNIAVSWQGPGIADQQVIAGRYVDTFALAPLRAFSPHPADGAVEVDQAPVLSWGAGEHAVQHDVYFGDDPDAITAADPSSAFYKDRQSDTSFDPGELEWGSTYYWRIDEIAEGDPESPWVGPVWSFTTADFLVIDDFESYTDAEGNRVYQTWIDGYADGTSGSTVGHLEAPFAEQTIVHGGRQSMPLDYNDIAAPYYSEATRTFDELQDWTAHGVTNLSLWFRGRPISFLVESADTITMSASGNDIWNTADQFRFAYKRLNGNGALVAKVESIGNTNAWAKAGVMIRESLEPGSKFAYVVVTPGNGVSFGWRISTNDTCGSATQAGVTAPQWVKLIRTGDIFTAQYSADGNIWLDIKDTDGAAAATTVVMTGAPYAGLAMTSHNVDAVTTARFSGILATGGISGLWQDIEIGADHRGNAPESLYLAVEDSAAKAAVVIYPDPAAANVTDWTEWRIPLSRFSGAGVNLARVKRMYIGTGDRENPQRNGTGVIYIDDFRLYRPAEAPAAQ